MSLGQIRQAHLPAIFICVGSLNLLQLLGVEGDVYHSWKEISHQLLIGADYIPKTYGPHQLGADRTSLSQFLGVHKSFTSRVICAED